MQPTRLRWKVPFTLCLLAGVTYLVRICISVAAPYIQRDLTLDNIQMSYFFSAFPLAYAIFEMPTGPNRHLRDVLIAKGHAVHFAGRAWRTRRERAGVVLLAN